MKTRIICLLIFLIGSIHIVYAQKNIIDSLEKKLQQSRDDTGKVNILNSFAHDLLWYMANYQLSKEYAYKALDLSVKLNFKKGQIEAYRNIAYYFGFQTNFPEQLKFDLSALKISQETQNKQYIADSYSALANTYSSLENYPEAQKNNLSALKIYTQLNDKKSIAFCNHGIGLIESTEGNDSAALEHFLIALKTYKDLKDTVSICQSYTLIGDIYRNKGEYEKALTKYNEAYSLFEKMGSNAPSWAFALCYQGLGDIYEGKGDAVAASTDTSGVADVYKKAYENYYKSSKIWDSLGRNGTLFKDATSSLHISLGRMNIKLKNISSAKDYLINALKVSIEIQDKENLKNCYKSLSVIDSIEGNYKQAFDHYKLFITYRDSLVNEENRKKSIQNKLQYEFDRKEAIDKAVQEKKDIEARRIKNLQYFVIASLAVIILAVMIIAFIQWRNNNQKQKTNTLLLQQKEKVETTLSELKSTQAQLIQSEKMASLGELTAGIAHEIQNPLNFVNNFSEVNTELIEEMVDEVKKGNTEEALLIANDIKDNEEKINHHGKRADAIVKGMLQHSRSSSGQKEPTDINALCEEYLRLAYHGLRAKDKSFNAKFETHFDAAVPKINLVPQDIGRVLLNLINNAFYAVSEKQRNLTGSKNLPGLTSYEPTVTISTKKSNNKIEIRVKDNGNGIPESIKEKIFQPFFTTKPTGLGTGLGLSLSYDIITKGHGGLISVETEEGKGSEFIILL